jgi:hypothetical protein
MGKRFSLFLKPVCLPLIIISVFFILGINVLAQEQCRRIFCKNGDCAGCCEGEKSCPDAWCDTGFCDPFSYTCVCDLGCGAECEDDNDCPSDGCSGACPGCQYRSYYCSSSSCACLYYSYNPDISSSYCTSCGETWLSNGQYGTRYCCGDDVGEDWDTLRRSPDRANK